MKVKGEVSIAKGMDNIMNCDLERMVKIQNVCYRKLKNLELRVSIPQLHIACSSQRIRVVVMLGGLFLSMIWHKIYWFEL
jgi:hypothetical protein